MEKSLILRSAVLELATVTRSSSETVPVSDDGSGALEARLIQWDVPAVVSDDGGRTRYTESWAAGSLVPAPVVPVYGGHRTGTDGRVERGPLIGVARQLETRADGLHGTLSLADTGPAREVRELARMVGAFVSIEAEAAAGADGATIVRGADAPVTLTGIAVILPPARPAHAGSLVTAVRARSDPPDPDPDPDDPDPDDPPTLTRGAVEEWVRAAVAGIGRGAADGSSGHPAARWHTFGEWWQDATSARSAASDDRTTIARALQNQITTDNPGVVPPGWVSEVQGIITRPRRLISAFGPFPDPGYGNEIDYPLFTGDLHALVGKQTAEKTAIVSVKVPIGKGSVTLTTLAGGSDLSYQLIRRSSPSYREAYLRIMSAAYAVVSDATASAEALAGATAGPSWDGVSAASLRASLFEASAAVEAATGSPAAFALASPAVFGFIGGLADLYPGPYGTSNASGTATASTLRVEVSGLPVIPCPGLADNNLIVSNGEAAGWVEDGPFAVTAEDVELLGQNVALWGMGGMAIPIPAGVLKLAVTPPAGTQSSRSSK